MAPKRKQAQKQAEPSEKTIRYLLIDHKGKLLGSLGLVELVVQPNATVASLMRRIKGENENTLRPFDIGSLHPWTYKHEDILLLPTVDELAKLFRNIEFSKASENLKWVSTTKKVTDIGLAEDVILLVQALLPLWMTDTATAEMGEPEASLPSIEKAHLMSVLQGQQAPSPLSVVASAGRYQYEQDNRPIYNGRPYECHSSPVVIYHESLANLKQNLDNLSKEPDPPSDTVRRTAELFCVAAETSECEREYQIYDLLGKLLGINTECAVITSKVETWQRATGPDAFFHAEIKDTTFGKKKAAAVYLELKNDLGFSGDGGLRAALSLRKHVTEEDYKQIRNVSCCPCIIISISGLFFQVSGAVLTDVFIVQSFTDYIYFGGDPFDTKKIHDVAKVFHVTAEAVRTLDQYYFFLRLKDQIDSRNHLPNPTFLNSIPCERPIFKSRAHFDSTRSGRWSLFHAEYQGKNVLVKFCETYSENAHSILAAARLAPALYFCSMITGGVFMVVMDLVEGSDAYQKFKNEELPSAVMNDIQRALKKLHDADLVFGDIRRPNVMVYKPQGKDDEEWRGLLVDFDWAGPVGEVSYPMLNKRISWTDGVRAGAEIKKDHDKEMLKRLRCDRI